MKTRLVLTFILSMVLSVCNAQSHLRFMGIPLTGSLSSFQSKLLAKGCRLDKSTSATLPVGVRMFTGRFAGEDASIFVYYDENTYRVYRAKAVIDNTNVNFAERVYSDMKSMLQSKYAAERSEEGSQDGHESFTLYVTDDTDSYLLGAIGLYWASDETYYGGTEYTVHIDYEDADGFSDHADQKMEDL